MRPLVDVAADLEADKVIATAKDDLSVAWTEFLGRYKFEWFVTFTFRDEVHPENADKLFRLWINSLNRFLHGPRYARTSKHVFWVRAIEWQKRGVLHFHALIGDTIPIATKIGFGQSRADRSCLMFWTELWFDKAGICRIDEIRDNTDEVVHRYVAKYVSKDGEIDVSGNLKDFIPPQRGLLGR